jgi:hypothetical protein
MSTLLAYRARGGILPALCRAGWQKFLPGCRFLVPISMPNHPP